MFSGLRNGRADPLVRSRPPGRLLTSALLLLMTGCGYISNPLPPLANIPNPIPDLATVQRGAAIIVHFTVPTITTENHPIQKSVKLDLRIGIFALPFRIDDWASNAKP